VRGVSKPGRIQSGKVSGGGEDGDAAAKTPIGEQKKSKGWGKKGVLGKLRTSSKGAGPTQQHRSVGKGGGRGEEEKLRKKRVEEDKKG